MIRLIPIWVTVLASLITISGLAFSVTLYFSPQTFFPLTNFLLKDIHHFTDMWAMQQFAISAYMVYALVLQRRQLLLTGLQLMICMNIVMAIDNVVTYDRSLLAENLVNLVLCILMVIAVTNRKSTNH
jgi:hypothetical protein